MGIFLHMLHVLSKYAGACVHTHRHIPTHTLFLSSFPLGNKKDHIMKTTWQCFGGNVPCLFLQIDTINLCIGGAHSVTWTCYDLSKCLTLLDILRLFPILCVNSTDVYSSSLLFLLGRFLKVGFLGQRRCLHETWSHTGYLLSSKRCLLP